VWITAKYASFNWRASRTVLYSVHIYVCVFPSNARLSMHLTTHSLHMYAPSLSSPKPPRTHSPRLDELGHHGNHQIEQTHSLDEGETQNGVREELATHAWVASHGEQERREDHADTDGGSAETDGGRTHADVPGDLDHGVGDFGRVRADGLAADVKGIAGELGGLLALEGLEGVGADAG
jgi:hypothetical protein